MNLVLVQLILSGLKSWHFLLACLFYPDQSTYYLEASVQIPDRSASSMSHHSFQSRCGSQTCAKSAVPALESFPVFSHCKNLQVLLLLYHVPFYRRARSTARRTVLFLVSQTAARGHGKLRFSTVSGFDLNTFVGHIAFCLSRWS